MQEVLKKLQEHDKRFDQVDKRFDQVDGQIDFIAKKVLDHDDQFQWFKENMATRADMSNISNTLNKIVGLVEKNDQEMTLLSRDLKSVEKDVKMMKPLLGLS